MTLKLAQKALSNAREVEGRSSFYACSYARQAAVLALKAWLDAHGLGYPTERPGTNSVAELHVIASCFDDEFEAICDTSALDWWPMPPGPGEVVPAIAQFLCSSPETADTAIIQALRVVDLVEHKLVR